MCSEGTPQLGDQRLPERFWTKVQETSGGCWEWTASRYVQNGYGQFGFKGKNSRTAHSVAWEALIGPVPEGLELDHLCRNRACCNPAHLEPVTHRENTLRGTSPSALHAKKTHCPKGHPYEGDNLLVRVKDGGRKSRECRACTTEQRRARREREDPAAVNARRRAAYAADREERLAKRRAARASADLDEVNAKRRAAYAAKRDELNARRRARRAAKLTT